MYLNRQWRVITIGDGDLSFSRALVTSHRVTDLVATVFDSEQALSDKYGDEHFKALTVEGITVLNNFDICDPQSWGSIERNYADLVIFQFPLRTAFRDQGEFSNRIGSDNLLNRLLLRQFLKHSKEHLLSPHGAGLCYITSKDVKPYSHWNIENALHKGTGMHFRGYWPFCSEDFAGYRIRNVERDKFVPDTHSRTYVWSMNENQLIPDLQVPAKHLNGHCPLCGAGPFMDEKDRVIHEQSRRHRLLEDYDKEWQEYLTKIEDDR